MAFIIAFIAFAIVAGHTASETLSLIVFFMMLFGVGYMLNKVRRERIKRQLYNEFAKYTGDVRILSPFEYSMLWIKSKLRRMLGMK